MFASRKLFIAFLCPLLLAGVLLAVQGCGGGGTTEEAETPEETESMGQAETEAETEGEAQAQGEEDRSMYPEQGKEERVALAGYTCPLHPDATSLAPGRCGQCGAVLKDAHVIYVCTMCPDVVSHDPGVCPQCKMDLVLRPVPTEEAEQENTETTH